MSLRLNSFLSHGNVGASSGPGPRNGGISSSSSSNNNTSNSISINYSNSSNNSNLRNRNINDTTTGNMGIGNDPSVRRMPPSATMTAATQFQGWARERDYFQQAAEKANREQAQLEELIKQVRQQQREMGQTVHETSDRLGRVHREREMLTSERARLKQTLDAERNELEQCANEKDLFVQADFRKKKEFCQTMQGLNSELADLLSKQEEFRLQNLISKDTAPMLLEYYHNALPAQEANDSQQRELEAAIQLLDGESSKNESALAKLEKLGEIISIFRKRATQVPLNNDDGLSEPQFLSTSDLHRLEETWMQESTMLMDEQSRFELLDEHNQPVEGAAVTKLTHGDNAPVHLQLFYGTNCTAETESQENGEKESHMNVE